MSTRINLLFKEYVDEALAGKIEGYLVIRLTGMVSFKGAERFLDPKRAIIDTGAHISLVPFSIWKNAKVEHITDHYLQGVIPKKDCTIPVSIGRVSCVLLDRQGNVSSELEMLAYLALTDEIPLVLGFKDLLSRFKVCFDYDKREAYIEIKD